MLVTNDDGSYSQCGITSWGLSTCNTAYPSVYTRVSYFRQWIDDNMSA
jgi:elastase-2